MDVQRQQLPTNMTVLVQHSPEVIDKRNNEFRNALENSGNEQLGRNRSTNTVPADELIDLVDSDSDIDVSQTQWNCALGDFEQPAKLLKTEPTSDEENTPPKSSAAYAGSVRLDGYTYSLQDHHRNMKGDVNCYYRCEHARTAPCKGRLTLTKKFNGEELSKKVGFHACDQKKISTVGSVYDAREDMRNLVATKAVHDLSKSAQEIATDVLDHVKSMYKERLFQGLNLEQLRQHVYKARRSEFADWASRIESFPLAFTSSNDERLFLQYHFTVNINGQLHRILGWAHPDLIFRLKGGKVRGFFDGTFRVVPKGFKQLLIFMAYLDGYDVYVPVFYVLIPGKLQKLYKVAIQGIIDACDGRLQLSTFTADFEQAILNTARALFSDAPLIGCLFHWKQALRRKLLELRVPKAVIHQLLGVENSLMDLLTVIPIPEIVVKGILYIHAHFNEQGNEEKFNSFWSYFVNTWIREYPADLWNFTRSPSARDNMVNRTNNPLERYNRTLNQAFPCAHPTMDHFITTINAEARRYARLLEDIQRGYATAPPHLPVPVPTIPPSYHNYQIPQAEMRRTGA